MKWLALLITLVSATPALARVFNLQKERLSSYLMAGTSQSNLKSTPWMGESSAVGFSDVYSAITSGEFGLTYTNSPLGFRFGVEIIKPLTTTGQALNAGGTAVYSYQTNINVVNPKVGVDINVYTGPSLRLMVFGFYGVASYSSSTAYTGLTIAPNADHSVELRSSAPCYGGGIGGEIAFFDTTTFVFDVAYRQLKFVNLKYANNVNTFDGNKVSGDPAVNSDGSNRIVDFTGVVINAGLRFYLF